MHFKINLREIFRRAKEVTGLSQKDIAKQVYEITDSNLNNKIRVGSVRLHVLAEWIMHYKVNLHWLLTGEGDPDGAGPETVQEPMDLELLTEVVIGIERFLRSENLELDPKPKARLIVLLYDRFHSAKERPKKKVIQEYLKLAS